MDKNQYLELLEKIVNIPSSTKDKVQVNAVNDLLESFLAGLGFKIKRYSSTARGDLLVAHNWQTSGAKKVLLSGHTDIVELKHFTKFSVKSGIAYGSGIADMKSGLLVMLGVAKQLINTKFPINLTLVFTPDEELGSGAHREMADKIYRQHDYALAFETGKETEPGNRFKERILVDERKGATWVDIKVFGQGGHAGNNVAHRDNAIEEMAEKIVAAKSLMDVDKGTLVNVGTISGGEAGNVIARYCKVTIDVRTSTSHEQEKMIDNLRQIAKTNGNGTKSEFAVTVKMPPLEKNKLSQKLLTAAEAASQSIGLQCVAEKRGGGSDANYISGQGVAVLDGFGAVAVNSDDVHTPREAVYVDSIFQNMDLVREIISKLSI